MSTTDSQILKCQCGAKLKVPAAAAGRKIRCPKCEFTMVVPQGSGVVEARMSAPAGPPSAAPPRPTSGSPAAAPAARKAPSPPPAAPSADADFGGGLFDELASAESSAASTAVAPAAGATCPKCGRPMKSGSTACPTCGYDTAPKVAAKPTGTGKAVAATKDAAAKAASAGTRLMIGCVLSSVGALIGAGVWYYVAMKWHGGFGLIAIGVGLMAGFGMMIGIGKAHELAGMVAGAIALGGIILGKVLVWQASWSPAALEQKYAWPVAIAEHHAQLACFEQDLYRHSDECESIHEKEFARVEKMTPEELKAAHRETEQWKQERWNDDAYVTVYLVHDKAGDVVFNRYMKNDDDFELDVSKEDWAEHCAKAKEEVLAMSVDERRTKAQELEKEYELDPEITNKATQLVSKIGFWWTMLNPFSLIFMALGVGAAYKLAGSGIIG